MDGDIGAEGPADGVGGRDEAELGEEQRKDEGRRDAEIAEMAARGAPQDGKADSRRPVGGGRASDGTAPAGGRAGGSAPVGSAAGGRGPSSAVESREAKGGRTKKKKKPANANRGAEPTGTTGTGPSPGGGILSPTGLSAFLTQCSLLLGHAAWCRRARRPCPFDEASVAAAHGLVRDGYLRRGRVPPADELGRAAECVSLAGELLRIDRSQGAKAAGREGGADGEPDGDGAARYRSMEAARMREAADAAPRPRVERYEGGGWVTAHVDQRRPPAEKREEQERQRQQQRRESRPGEGAENGAETAAAVGTSAPSDPDARRSAASIIEKSQRAARRLLEARELVSSIAKACAGRSIVLDGGDEDDRGGDDRANFFVESLVGHYRPEYGALTARRLRDALRRSDAEGRGRRRRATRNSRGLRLEGHLPAVIRRTDKLMEEYRRKIECMKRKRGNVSDEEGGAEPHGGRRGGGGREGPTCDGYHATLRAYREQYWPAPEEEEEESEHSARRPGPKTAGDDGGLSDPDMLDGEEGSSDCDDDDDGLDLCPAGARRPVKRLRSEGSDGSDVEPHPAGARRPVKLLRSEDSDDSDVEPHPAGAKRPVKWLRSEDSDDSDVEPHPPGGEDRGSESDDDDDEDPSDSKVPYSVRVERGRGGSTKYGTESNNYNTSHFDEDTPRGEVLTRVLERYTREREKVARVKRSRLLEFLDEARAEDPGRYGPVEMDLGWLSRKLGKEHKKRHPGLAPHKSRAMYDEMYRRYSAVRRGLPPGAKVPPGCIESIVEAVKAENPLVDLGSKVVSTKTMLNLRYAREFPESKGSTGQKLMSTWDPEARRRRERLYNEITSRYKGFKDANPKRVQEDTLGRIIRETMDDLDIHEFDVVPGSIRGRLQRKSLHVQKLGGTDRYHELDGPLVATLNGWLARGMSVTRADGLNLANTLLRGNDLGDGNEVELGAYWWRAFLNRNGHRLNCEDGGSFGR